MEIDNRFINMVLLIFSLSFINLISAKPQAVTCGSTVKLMNSQHKVRLHSHDVKYGSGSGQQSVTGTVIKEDVNSHWTIKESVATNYTQLT